MAQGNLKKSVGGGKKKSVASAKKQQSKQLSKGRKNFKPKGQKSSIARDEALTTKAINKKNEEVASARALGAGNTFFLQELKDAGTKEIQKQKRNQMRAEKKTHTLSSRLKDQLRKMGKDV